MQTVTAMEPRKRGGVRIVDGSNSGMAILGRVLTDDSPSLLVLDGLAFGKVELALTWAGAAARWFDEHPNEVPLPFVVCFPSGRVDDARRVREAGGIYSPLPVKQFVAQIPVSTSRFEAASPAQLELTPEEVSANGSGHMPDNEQMLQFLQGLP